MSLYPSHLISLAPCTVAATRRITGSLIGTMGIVTLLPFVQLDGLWKCIYDTFPGAAAAFNAASFHIELRCSGIELYVKMVRSVCKYFFSYFRIFLF